MVNMFIFMYTYTLNTLSGKISCCLLVVSFDGAQDFLSKGSLKYTYTHRLLYTHVNTPYTHNTHCTRTSHTHKHTHM